MTGRFVSHELNNLQEAEGLQLGTVGKMIIQNRICEVAETIVATAYSANHKETYMRGLAFAQGQIAMAEWILHTAEWHMNGRQGDAPVMVLPKDLDEDTSVE